MSRKSQWECFVLKTWRCRFCFESKVWSDKLSAAPRECQNNFLGKFIIFKCNIDWGKSFVSSSLPLHWWNGDSEVTHDISIHQNQDKSTTGKSTGSTESNKTIFLVCEVCCIELFRNITEIKILGGLPLLHLCNKRAGHAPVTAHPCLHGKTATNTFNARKGKSSRRRLKFYNFTLTGVFQQWGFEMNERIRKGCFRIQFDFLHSTAHMPHPDPTVRQVSWKQWPDNDAVELCGNRDRICVMNLEWIYC